MEDPEKEGEVIEVSATFECNRCNFKAQGIGLPKDLDLRYLVEARLSKDVFESMPTGWVHYQGYNGERGVLCGDCGDVFRKWVRPSSPPSENPVQKTPNT